jgi:serine/threonine protein kinase
MSGTVRVLRMPTEPVPRSESSTSFDRYTVLAELGQGGMAEVYLAVSRGLGGFSKLLVLKRLRSELALDETMATMFLDEARLAARLNHLNIVQTYEIGRIGERFFMSMEYLEGQPLTRIIRRGRVPSAGPFDAKKPGSVPLPLALRIMADVCAGLHYAHELKDFDGTPLHVVHRDVSPHNVFVTYDGHVKLVDFGIALANTRTTETETGVLKGKVAYMPPEQAQGVAVDRRADIFSAGVVLYEMISGERLWALRGDVDVLRDLLNGQVPNVSFDRFPSVSPDVARVVARALAAKPDDRYPTALQMRQDLVKCMDALATPVSIDDISERMTTIFAKERSETALLIERRLGEIERDGQSGDVLRTAMVAAGPPRIPDRTPSGGTYWSGRTSEGVESASDARDARSDVRASSSSRRRAVVFAIGAASAFCALVAAIVVSLQHSGGYPEERAFTATAASAHGTETGSAGGDPAPQELSVDKSRAPDPPAPSEAAASVESAPLRAAASPRPLVDAGKPGVRPSSATTSHAAPSPVIDPLGDRK